MPIHENLTDTPVADWLNPQELMTDPYPSYARLREAGDVVYAPALQSYLVPRYTALRETQLHPELFSVRSSDVNTMMERAFGGNRPMLRKDDPEHAVERQAINPTLRPRQIAQTWSPRFAQTVEHWIDHLLEVGPENADLNRDFAAPVASQNLIDLIGFPSEVHVDSLRRWSTDFIDGLSNVMSDPDIWARCDASRAEVNAVLDELIPHLRRHPDASITSHLLEVNLPEDVVRTNVMLTISGGMNEPQHMITNMVWALSTHPDQQRTVRAGEVSWGDAFEEVVRWVSPIGMAPREATADIEWFDAKIPQGATVGLLFASANRDDSVFPRADELDVTRNARGHLGFGTGVHQCAGRWAAKNAVGEVAVPRLYERIGSLMVDDSRQVSWQGWFFRGLTALPVTWD